jgi:uncharacterized repeat protein (TIGR01451 family)
VKKRYLKRATLLLAIAAWWTAVSLSAARITLSNNDPRHSNPDLLDREWGARLRNFGNSGTGSEIYVGAGDLSFAGNRKVADMMWNTSPSGLNIFTFAYNPSPARFTVTAAGTTSASQFYDFQTPTANPNEVFNALLIRLEAKGNDNVVITNLQLTITGGATTSLGTIEVTQGQEVFGLIDDIAGAYTSGFTLTGNVVYPPGFQSPQEERPAIEFFALFDRGQPLPPDLTLSKSHVGNFIQGQMGATYTLTASNIGGGATTGTVTVVDTLPPGLVLTAAAGTGWTCGLSASSSTCTRTDALAPGASYPPIALTVNVAATAPPLVTNTATIVGGADGNAANNTVTDPTTIVGGADLTITKTASGSFTQGQIGASYTLAVSNTGGVATSGPVTIVDALPTGLTPTMASGTGWTCGISGSTVTCSHSDPLAPGASYPPVTLTVTVASNAPPSVTNQATVSGGGDLNPSNNTASAVTPIAGAADLTITKSHTGNFTQGQTAAYTVTVTNVGAAPTSAPILVTDAMLLPLIPQAASGTGWTCSTLTDLIRCQRSDALAPGASYQPITITASIASNAPPTVTNVVRVSGGGDSNPANNSASDVATVLPAADLSITKSHTGSFTQGQPGTYTLAVSNSGAAPTSGSVTVKDTLPTGLVPTLASGMGWTCTIAGQSISCTRNDALAAGQSYPTITLTVEAQANAPASVTNTALVFGGGETNPSNNTATDPTTINAGANLTITKSHTGTFTQGQTGLYALTVSNAGGAATFGSVTVTDNLPAGLAASAATGTGWSCMPSAQTVTCQRSDVLNPGTSYPTISLTVEVATNAPASVTNTAQVSGGSDVDATNNTATDPTTVVVVPDLTVSKTHSLSFQQGQVGATYTLTVANIGSGPTAAAVSVSDVLPAGLTPTAAEGAGWMCTIAAQNVTCSRGDPLSGGTSYPAITLTVNVAPAAPPSLTNTATVSGGGEVNTGNNTADDITTIGPGTDLTVSKNHSGNFLQGATGATFTITVSNPGSPPSSGVVTVTDSLPAGLVPTAATGTGWGCGLSGQDVTCTRSDPLPTGESYSPITLTVSVQSLALGSVTNVVAVSNAGDINPLNNTARDLVLIVPGADLTITKTHTGDFVQGQTGTYTVTVTNAGVGPTTSTVAVIDALPLGLTPTTAGGPGWTCSVASVAVGCERTDALAAAASYPPIVITVTVAADAPTSVTNTVGVAGGGDSNSANNAATDITAILPGADPTVTKSHTGNFTQGQKGAAYTLTVSNSGSSPTAGAITVVDTLPSGLVPSTASGGGWSCTVDGQTITCLRNDPLSAGSSYPPITLMVDVASNAPSSLTNTATVSGGRDVNPANNTASDVTSIGLGPDLTVTKTHVGDFFQGQTGASYTITVTNQGGAPSTGPVLVIDDLSGQFQNAAASGMGWTCTPPPSEVVQCERSDALAVGASYPAITITVDVPASAPPSVTNVASVSGGGDVNAANNSATDPTTITRGPDLTITKSHTATFTQGQRGAVPALDYTLLVSNVGGVPTTGMVTLIDSVPTGLIPVAAAGPGWTCTVSLQSVTCTRSDPLAGGATYPAVTLTVDVQPDAPASVVNTATIAGGADVNGSNNTAVDPTPINRGQDLTIAKSHTGHFTQGQRGATYTIGVTNVGAAPTIGTVTLIDVVPDGLFLTAASGTGWTCEVSGQTSSCVRGDSLPAGASYEPVTITVDVAPDAPATITNRAIVVGGGDVSQANNTAEDVTAVVAGPDLTLVKTHPSPVGPGQSGLLFQLTATNRGGAPTDGLVAVVDELPVGLTPTAAGGSGWTCEILDLVVACARRDALAPGASYAPIMIAVNVARLPIGSTLLNTASVSRGGDVTLDNNAAEDLVVLSRRTICDVNGDGFDEIVTGAGPGGGPHVNVWTLATGAVTNLASFYAYHPLFGGGAFVGCGDLNGDGLADVVTGAGAGSGPHVRAFSLASGYPGEIASFFAYAPAFTGGVRVAAADVDGDGRAEIITGAGPGGGPHVRVFRLVGGTPVEIAGFFAYAPGFTGGVFVAGGDVTGDGRAAIITGTYQGGGPVRVFTLGASGVAERAAFFPYFSGFSGTVRVGAGDVNGDGVMEIITGAGPGGGPHVHAFTLVGGALTDLASFYAYAPPFCDIGLLDPDPVFCDGVYVAGGDVNGDGVAEVITGSNRQAGPLRIFRIGAGVTELASFYPYFEAFRGPVYVAAVAPGHGSELFEPSRSSSASKVAMDSMNRWPVADARLARMVFGSDPLVERGRSPPLFHKFHPG